MSIVISGSSRELAQLIGAKRHIRRQSGLDPFVLLIRPVEWLTDGFLWLLEWLAKRLMSRAAQLVVIAGHCIQALVLLLILFKEHQPIFND